MRIGITYDLKEDYVSDRDDKTHADFSSPEGISYIQGMLEAKGHTVTLIGSFEKLDRFIRSGAIENIDIVFNTAEGLSSRNREGFIPSLLEAEGIPYVGTDAYGSSLSLDKIRTKMVCAHLGIPTPAYYEINRESDLAAALKKIGCPCILKPNTEGTSSGVVLAEEAEDFFAQGKALLKKYGPTLLCEKYVEGREFTVPIIGNGISSRIVGIVETVRRSGEPLGVYSLEDKESDSCTKALPSLPTPLRKKLERYSLALHNYLGCADYNRADFRVSAEGKPYFLELNALPDMSADGSYSLCCALLGISFADVLNEIVTIAYERWQRQPRLR